MAQENLTPNAHALAPTSAPASSLSDSAVKLPVMLYDGDCGICQRAVTLARWLDRRERLQFHPFQSWYTADLARYGLTEAACQYEVKVIAASERVYGGAFAINYFLWQMHWGKPLVVWLYLFPPLLLLEWLIYRIVARNRTRLSRWLGLQACAWRPPAAAVTAAPSATASSSPFPPSRPS